MESKQLSGKKLKWFKVVAFTIPVILLALTELLLRISGYGHDTSLFIRYPDNLDYWVFNKYASGRYFSDSANATKGSIEPFHVKKTTDIFRIFVLGESTTAGYPYFHNGSFHRWLGYRLMRTYPTMHFEIINVSLTAVNSYTVLDFGKQIAHYQPDAVLIYTGHNEYYGAMGVGSTSHFFTNRFLAQTVIFFRRFRLVQLIENCLPVPATGTSGKQTDERKNLMERMAARQRIPYRSSGYYAGIDQFQKNMEELCRYMQGKKIPVFLSTLVSNEKDLEPFISDSTHGTMTARHVFETANSAYKAGLYARAKQLYVEAKELDLLRFRAPDTMNKIIVSLTKKYACVHLVDARSIFEQHSPHNILGNETLLEHVHPNLYGYALLSDAFYQAIQKFNLIKAIPAGQISFADLLDQMPVTTVDSLSGAYTIMMLEAGWPFNKPIGGFARGNTIEEQLAGALSVNRISWIDAMNTLFQYSMKKNDKKTALKAVEATLLEHPENITYYMFAGRLHFELGDKEDAAFYFQKAYDIEPSAANAQNLYIFYLKTDQPEKALDYVTIFIKENGADSNGNEHKKIVLDLIQLKRTLSTDSTNPGIKTKIAGDYQQLNEPEMAAKYGRINQ